MPPNPRARNLRWKRRTNPAFQECGRSRRLETIVPDQLGLSHEQITWPGRAEFQCGTSFRFPPLEITTQGTIKGEIEPWLCTFRDKFDASFRLLDGFRDVAQLRVANSEIDVPDSIGWVPADELSIFVDALLPVTHLGVVEATCPAAFPLGHPVLVLHRQLYIAFGILSFAQILGHGCHP